jgi:hypothetical protein
MKTKDKFMKLLLGIILGSTTTFFTWLAHVTPDNADLEGLEVPVACLWIITIFIIGLECCIKWNEKD